MTSITIIEDDASFARLLKKIIEAQEGMQCTAIFHNAEDALAAFPAQPTDVILMDIQLPGRNGVSLTEEIKKQVPTTHVIMCTSFDDDDKIFNALKNGAEGYLLKSESPDNIIGAIQEVMRGGAPMSSGIAKKVVRYFQHLPTPTSTPLPELSNKENELLSLLSQGLFYKEIADRMHISMDTVKKHCGSIYRKLHVSNRTEAINKFFGR